MKKISLERCGSSHYFKEQVFLKVCKRRYFRSLKIKIKKKKQLPYIGWAPPISDFWVTARTLQKSSPSEWLWDTIILKQPLNKVNSLMRTPEEMMSIKCIFIPLLALALPGNWVSSCSWVAHLDEAASMTLVDVCFMLQGVWKQTGSDPRRLEYLEWRERLWASFVTITLHLRAILISFGIDSIQIRH